MRRRCNSGCTASTPPLVQHRRCSEKHGGVSDPLEVIAGEISDESILLCLDEFMVTDVADALILNRLFSHLFTNGAVSDYWVLLQAFNKGE
ncbi:putative hexokinase [Helianthus annuus]|uniref:Hexokinase n=1 Tax=Helianthus annuus TaxID=4232 RepID=A0A251UV58_HELAN|nr:putative hexokinase [Helianthus annuus]